jgi:hypothetical protein
LRRQRVWLNPHLLHTGSDVYQVGTILTKIFKFFKIIEKSKNAGNCLIRAQNGKFSKKLIKILKSKFSKILSFVRFLDNFQHISFFWKF